MGTLENLTREEDIKAADTFYEIALEIEKAKKESDLLESKLIDLKAKKKSLMEGCCNLMERIEKKYPLVVQRANCIVIVSQNSCIIERNVI